MPNPFDYIIAGSMPNSFDYIIAGSGMAGLSLAFYLNESSLRDKKVLIIDREIKNSNDHTWCFWEKENGAFEEIVFREWRSVWFHGTDNFSRFLSLGEYRYKMIRAADFYGFIIPKLQQNRQFTFLQADIQEIAAGIVKTDKGEFYGREFVFDSFTRRTYDNPHYQNLWQHFSGWLIETKGKVFKPDEPTLFDFRTAQKDECRFVYILPFSENKALIEFTIFSDNLQPPAEYELHLREYIAEVLKIGDFKLLETESGIIPMSDEPHAQNPLPKVIRIGTAGGYIKPSTGYSFQRTQRRLKELVFALQSSIAPTWPLKSEIKNWKSFLDSILLNVLQTNKHPANDVFTCLFAKNPASQVLKFLDEDTNLGEDLKIMQTVPLTPFARATARVILKKIRKSLFKK